MMRLVTIILVVAAAANTINVKLPSGEVLKVELAASPEDLGRGLIGRKSVSPGMLFVYPGDMRTRYNLMGYLMPVDILYIGEDKTIVNLRENVPPCPTTAGACGYDSIWTHRYALQLPAGSVKRFNLRGGDVLSFDPPRNLRTTRGK